MITTVKCRRQHRSRLTEADLAAIRARYLDATLAELAAEDTARAKREIVTRSDLEALCQQHEIPVPRATSTATLASTLASRIGWRAPSVLVAADLGDDNLFEPRPATVPTGSRPGTAERIAVYAARVEAGEDIWHPGDAD